jgi:enoyl-CoA hydratase/carnithine racemase
MALIDQLLQGAPHAQRYTKQLTRDSVRVHESQLSELLDQASQLLAEQAHSKEGREGLTAFLNKRKPSW